MSEVDLSDHLSARKHCIPGDNTKKDDKVQFSGYVFSHEFRSLIDITEDQPHVYTHEHSNIMDSNSVPDTPLPGQTFSGTTSPRQLSRGNAATPSHAYRTVYQAARPLRRSPERDAMLAAVASRTSTPSRHSSGTQIPTLQQGDPESLATVQGSPERDMSHRGPQRRLPNPLEGRPVLLAPPSNAPSTPLSPHASPFYGSSSQPQSAFAPPAKDSSGTSNTRTGAQAQGSSNTEYQSPQGVPNPLNRPPTSSPYTPNAFQQNNTKAAPQTHQSVQQRDQKLSSPYMNPSIQQSPFIHTPQPFSPAFQSQPPSPQHGSPYTHTSPQQLQNPYQSPHQQQQQNPYIHVSPQQHHSPYGPPHQQQHQNPYQSPHPQSPYIHAPTPRLAPQPQLLDPHSTLSTPRAEQIYPLADRISSTPLNLPPQEPAARKQFARDLLETLERDKKLLIQKRWETFKEMNELEMLLGELKERRNEMIARQDWSGSSEGEIGVVDIGGEDGGGGNRQVQGHGSGNGAGDGHHGQVGGEGRKTTPTMPAAMRAMIAAAGSTTPFQQTHHQSQAQPLSTDDQTPTQSPQRYQDIEQVNQTPTLGQQIRMLDQELKRVKGVHEGYGNMVGNVSDNIEQMWDAVVGLEGEGWD